MLYVELVRLWLIEPRRKYPHIGRRAQPGPAPRAPLGSLIVKHLRARRRTLKHVTRQQPAPTVRPGNSGVSPSWMMKFGVSPGLLPGFNDLTQSLHLAPTSWSLKGFHLRLVRIYTCARYAGRAAKSCKFLECYRLSSNERANRWWTFGEKETKTRRSALLNPEATVVATVAILSEWPQARWIDNARLKPAEIVGVPMSCLGTGCVWVLQR